MIEWCKVTGRRHRVSPCRSAYFACPWWLLAFDLRRRSREAALLFPESWWHLTMRGSRPSLSVIIPNTKRHQMIRERTNYLFLRWLPAFQGRTITWLSDYSARLTLHIAWRKVDTCVTSAGASKCDLMPSPSGLNITNSREAVNKLRQLPPIRPIQN